MTRHLDLRCSRRLTVEEGRLILAALEQHAQGRSRAGAMRKIQEAIELAIHQCDAKNRGKCSICGGTPRERMNLRRHRAKLMVENLDRARVRQRQVTAADRLHGMLNPPRLRLRRS